MESAANQNFLSARAMQCFGERKCTVKAWYMMSAFCSILSATKLFQGSSEKPGVGTPSILLICLFSFFILLNVANPV